MKSLVRRVSRTVAAAATGIVVSSLAGVPAFAQRPTCHVLLDEAAAATKLKNHKQAINLIRATFDICPAMRRQALYLHRLALAFSADGQLEEADAIADFCLEVTTNNRDEHLGCMVIKGQTLSGLKRIAEARLILNRAMREPALTDQSTEFKNLGRSLLAKLPVASTESAGPPPRPPSTSGRHGTGFFVSSDGHVVTNFHVVNGCRSITTRNGTRLVHVGSSRKLDLALLQQPDTGHPRRPAAVFRQGHPVIGESVVAFGFPLTGLLASSGNVTTGIVSATSGLRDDPTNFQITAPIQPGNSGGPLLDQAGQVIGVVVSKLDAAKISSLIGDVPQNVNFAIRGSEVIDFIVRNGIEPTFEHSKDMIGTVEIASKAQSVSVQLVCTF